MSRNPLTGGRCGGTNEHAPNRSAAGKLDLDGRGQSRLLPATGWTWQTTIEEGYWRNLEACFVDIPASLGFDHGVWFRIRQGIRGILVPDEHGAAIVYMICEPASHYYQIMTRASRMPVLIEERI